MENRSRRFPLTDQEIHQWMMMMTYQRLMNINSGYRLPENARGSGFGWAQEPAMATMMPSADMMNFCNHQPLGNNSGNGMYIPPPLQVIPPESTTIPLSVPAMPMPTESVPPLMGRKKAPKRWSPEEHKLFLIGLKKFKRGDWKSISRSMVVTRSPTQVASHAQKYFNRRGAKAQATATDDESTKKRSSIHDTRVEDVAIDPDEIRSLQDKINNQH